MMILLLFAAGLFAGTVDAIAGGGGLISLPVLLSTGMSPHLAFGTNKLQGTIGTFMAALKYYRHGYISLKKGYDGILFGVLGGISGAVSAQLVSAQYLHKIIPIMLAVILIYTLCSPKLGQQDNKAKMKESLFYLVFGFGLAFYDGFFGPGTGSFWVFALTFLLGYNLIKATAYTKLFNLNSSFIATICFALGGNIDYRFAFAMAAGQVIGGRLGAHLAITRGARLIRPIFLGVVSMTIASLIYKNYAGSPILTALLQRNEFLLAITILFISLVLIYLFINKRQKSVKETI